VTAEQAVFGRLGVEIRALRGFDTDEESFFDRLDEQVDHLLRRSTRPPTAWACCSTSSSISAHIW
jgi:hypothetical protein